MSEQRSRVAKSLAWTSLESFSLLGVSLISLVVYARYLTPLELGVTAMALSIVQLINLPIEVLFQDALIQKKHVRAIHFDTAFTVSMGLALSLLGVCWLASENLAAWLGEPALAAVLRGMSWSLPFMGMSSALVAWHRRSMAFRPLALRSLFGRLAGGGIGIALAISGAGMWSLVAQQVLTVALSSILLWLFAQNRPRWRVSWRACRQLLGFGLISTFYMFLILSVQRVFILFVGGFLGSQIAGYFNLAFRSVDVLRDLFAGAVSQLSLSVFARLQQSRGALERAFGSAMVFACALMFPLFAGLALCAPEIVPLIFGTQWTPAVPLVMVMALLTFEFFPRLFTGPLINAVGKPGFNIVGISLQLLIVVLGMLVLGRDSYYWATFFWIARALLTTPVEMFMFRRATGLSLRSQVQGLPLLLLCTLGMGVAVLAVGRLGEAWQPVAKLSAMVAVGAFSYPILLWLADRVLFQRILAFLGEVRRPST